MSNEEPTLEQKMNEIVEDLNEQLAELRQGRAYWQFMQILRGVWRDFKIGERDG